MSLSIPVRPKTSFNCLVREPSMVKSPLHTKLTVLSSPDRCEESLSATPSHVSIDRTLQSVDVEKDSIDIVSTQLIKGCPGVNCCRIVERTCEKDVERVEQPDNEAYRSLQLNIEFVPTTLIGTPEIPPRVVSLLPIEEKTSDRTDLSVTTQKSGPNGSIAKQITTTKSAWTNSSPASPSTEHAVATETNPKIDTNVHPPDFVQPHAPYQVYSAKVFSARELTRPGAEKRTYHFELDVSDYPLETGVDFRVGGAIGVCAPNHTVIVEEVLDLLCVPRHIRNKPVLLKTTSGRWPTVWGDEKPRELITTRRDLITWCSDIQSFRISKPILRLLAEYATSQSEKKILLYLTSNQGQSAFCDLRTGPYVTIPQLLHAFPSSKPPLDAMLSALPQLMARFYSLSNDPYDTCALNEGKRRIIEFAVTVWECPNWDGNIRTGVASGYLERQAKKFIEAEKQQKNLDIRIPMFKGLMANPLARDYASDGPMLLIGSGVGIAPFRGFVQRRLRNANCVNKVWVIQGIRDCLLDELYHGEWGLHENEVKKVVESRRSTGQNKYVQDEIVAQADLVWSIINTLDGRIFVCGSKKGMSEGVEKALIKVAISKANLEEEKAKEFWKQKKEMGQYIVEAWS